MRTLFATFVCTCCLVAGAEGPFFSPVSRTAVVAADCDTLTVSQKKVMTGSVRLFRRGVELKDGTDYRVDYLARRITLLSGAMEAETLLVCFEEFSLDFKPVYFHRSEENALQPYDSTAEAGGEASAPDIPVDEPSTLVIGGSKTIGISMGSGNAFSIDQALDVTIQGTVADNVSVRAILTDQNLPFQPEGNTESIREVDRVLVEIESPRLKGSLGDLYLAQTDARFGAFSRKVKGVQAQYRGAADGRISAAAAVSEGSYHVMEFHGQEQNQGPYRLTSKEGASGIIVLAGTERVLVDGTIKQRGENRDYIIEYGNGQIIFTPRCLITADNTITVEYEYSERDYPSTLLAGSGNASLFEKKLTLSGSIVRERDDWAHPVRGALDDNDRLAMKTAGDSGFAEGSGVFLMDPDSVYIYRGFYARSSAPDSHFIHYPPDSVWRFINKPIYDVSFTDAGAQGSYAPVIDTTPIDPNLSGTYARGTVYYEYRGTGNGSFVPGKRLSLPRDHAVGSFRYSFAPSGNITIHGETAASAMDNNALSDRDDRDNTGGATVNEFTLRLGNYIPEKGPGLFTLIGKQEYLQARFTPFSPVQNYYVFDKKWGLSFPVSRQPLLSTAEGSLAYAPLKQIEVTGAAGKAILDQESAYRASAGCALRANDRTLNALQEFIAASIADTEKSVERTTVSAGARIGKFSPRAGFIGEQVEKTRGPLLATRNSYQEYTAGAACGRIGIFSGENSITFRNDMKGNGDDPARLVDSAKGLTIVHRIALNGPAAATLDLEMTNRRSNRLEGGRWQSYGSDLVEANAAISPFDNACDVRLQYSLLATRSQVMVDLYEFVGAGLGDYRKDSVSGDYVFRPGGDYALRGARVDANAAGKDINAADLTLRISAYLNRLDALKKSAGFLKDLWFDTYISAEQDKYPMAYGGSVQRTLLRYIPDPVPGAVDGGVCARYLLSAKQDVNLQPEGNSFSLRLRLYPRFRYFYRPISDSLYAADEWNDYYYSLRVRQAFKKSLTIESEPSLEWIDRTKEQPALVYAIRNRKIATEVSWRAHRLLSFPLSLVAGQSDQTGPTDLVRATHYSLKPGIMVSVAEKGKAEASYEYAHVRTRASWLLYEMADGNAPGTTHRWSISANYAFNQNMHLNLFYAGEREDNAPKAVHRATAELKAYF
ncbi:MAG: hypothetical protein A2268_05945 [Candidatus Raymondbacteria bacterium RifOxyA12_full_50_37]|nr:MAG: hypothetical protein A2268_05945 [Candidatus Raymondbacteria bacterium RifOxyA12_full_50_37]OGJ94282.1 MAG: hypothetical protein A2248_14875 [Candidatus Raymondbacteria bacterium RIFOXYA2_FULL_49_16]OGJ96393.1 MAG: hypothetical protein A2487_00475 [Candidatus Raymondbacteria bacterium RifOxyC12_full_50_8]OGJ99112.1 MAG: hypothetical protein A2453_11285 [Candidatus Raymondbacteria bacterium RIFOXYC2_FULL_50_21]OGP45223.1 MAG: hypothetical protein A2324_10820 [Candidatus Raymondbacteria b